MADRIREQRALVKELYKRRAEADIAYVEAVKTLARLEHDDGIEETREDQVMHWHPPRSSHQLHWGEDS